MGPWDFWVLKRSLIPLSFADSFGLSPSPGSLHLATLPAHILQVVVEVHSTSTQVSPQQCGVGGEDRSHRQPPSAAQAEPNARQPFVEVRDHMWLLLALGQELRGNRNRATVSPRVL